MLKTPLPHLFSNRFPHRIFLVMGLPTSGRTQLTHYVLDAYVVDALEVSLQLSCYERFLGLLVWL